MLCTYSSAFFCFISRPLHRSSRHLHRSSRHPHRLFSRAREEQGRTLMSDIGFIEEFDLTARVCEWSLIRFALLKTCKSNFRDFFPMRNAFYCWQKHKTWFQVQQKNCYFLPIVCICTFVGLQRILIRCETESHTYLIEKPSVRWYCVTVCISAIAWLLWRF